MNDTVAVPPPAANGQVAENDDCALVVAIGNYRELAPLKGPAPDAIRFCTWLREKGGLKLANIKLVVNDEQGKPENSDIPKALNELGVRMKKRRGRRLYFYYAGHGLAPEFNNIALVPANAMQDALIDSCYSLNKCIDFFVKTGFFDELVVFMDCCREREEVPTIGLPYRFEEPFEGANPVNPVNQFVLMAAGDGAKSFEVRDLTVTEERKFRGLMTTALIEGLNGAPGAIDANNNVTSTSLSHYVATRVQEEAKANGVAQTVDKPKPPNQEIVFYSVPKNEVPTMAFRLVVGPQTAGQPIMMLNENTNQLQTEGPGQQGDIITFELEGNAIHRLIVPGRQPIPVDPATLHREPKENVQLP